MRNEDIFNLSDPPAPLAISRPQEELREGRLWVRVGSASGLHSEFEWHPVEAANGAMRLFVKGKQLWTTPVLHHEEWTRFLERMSSAWDRISAEEAYPLGATPEKPSDLRVFLQGSRSGGTEDIDLIIERFRNAHDLSTWMPIAREPIPSLWVMREGLLMTIESEDSVYQLPGGDTLWALEQVGDTIAKRLEKVDPGNSASGDWRRRYISDKETISKLFFTNLALPSDRANALVAGGIVQVPSKRSEALRGLDEVRAAARMIALRAPVETLSRICNEIRATPKETSAALEELCQAALNEMHSWDNSEARTQGIQLARWLRMALNISDQNRVEPEGLLSRWNVVIKRFQMPSTIEAVSFWGPLHGPAILLNPISNRVRGRKGDSENTFQVKRDLTRPFSGPERFTLAHEICHLLVDRYGSLPVTEVLGGSTPAKPEKRASVFASHFLVPIEQTAEIYRRSPTLQHCLQTIVDRYGVSISLARYELWWRARNANLLSDDDYAYMERTIEGTLL
jgi:hypothetical protein